MMLKLEDVDGLLLLVLMVGSLSKLSGSDVRYELSGVM